MITATSMQIMEINTVQLHEHSLHASTAIKEKDTVLASLLEFSRINGEDHLFTFKRDVFFSVDS